MNILNNKQFEVSYINNHYIVKKKLTYPKYYKLNLKQYEIFLIYLNGNSLTYEDFFEVYNYSINKSTYDKYVSNIENIFNDDNCKIEPFKKNEFNFKKLTERLNSVSPNYFSIFINKAFIWLTYILFLWFLPKVLFESTVNLSLPLIIFWTLINIILHELFHILTLRYFKREILGIGFKIVYVLPYFFVRTTDIMMCETKKRILVSLLGPTANIILGNLCYMLYLTSSDLIYINFATISYLFAISTFMPFLKSDGYRIICDLLDEDIYSKIFKLRIEKNMNFNIKYLTYAIYIIFNVLFMTIVIISIFKKFT